MGGGPTLGIEALAARAELEVLRWMHKTRVSFPLHRFIASVTSPRLGQDLASCVVILGIAGLWQVGYRLFWASILGCICFVIGKASFGPGWRPARYDMSLQSAFRANDDASVSGLVLFGTIVLGELALAADTWALSVLFYLGLLTCAYSRMLAMAHFPHQVAISILLGAGAMVLTRTIERRLPVLSQNQCLSASFLAGMFTLMVLLLRFESDDTSVRPFNLAKHEYKRVLYNIMDSDASLEQKRGSGNLKSPPKDSFVNLVRSLEARSSGQQYQKQSNLRYQEP